MLKKAPYCLSSGILPILTQSAWRVSPGILSAGGVQLHVVIYGALETICTPLEVLRKVVRSWWYVHFYKIKLHKK